MNEVVKFAGAGTGLMTREDMARALNNMSMEAPRVGGAYQFLKCEKGTGDWIYGQEDTLVEADSQWAVNPNSLQWGYIAWDPNQQVEGEQMVPITRPLPDKNALRVKGAADGQPTGPNGWQYQQAVNLVCISGEDAGVQAQYKQSSVGSQKLFKTIVDGVSSQMAKGSDAIVPIVVMKSDSYKHKKWGKIVNPIWEVIEWRTMDDGAAAGESAQAEKPVEAATPRTRSATPGATAAAKAVPDAKEPAIPVEGSDAEDKALEAEYQQEASTATATPRRRVRRP